MALLNPTADKDLCDCEGRPYFLWDSDLTLQRFQELLRNGDRNTRAYLIGKLMRQAKPDDVFRFVSVSEIRDLWADLDCYLGRSRPFWLWLLDEWSRDDGLEVTAVQSSDTFQRLRVTDGSEIVVVDLIAEPVAALEQPKEVELGSSTIRIHTEHEILVNKLCALLSRSELRDLVDTQALLGAGGDLARAAEEGPRKDTGFSAVTLAWVLKDLPLRAMADTDGWDDKRVAALSRFRDRLVRELTDLARPDEE